MKLTRGVEGWSIHFEKSYKILQTAEFQNLTRKRVCKLTCLEAYLEFKEIEHRIPENSLIVFTDGSVRDEFAGSGVVIFSDNQIIGRIMASIKEVSIDHAELLAVYFLLKWLQREYHFY